MKYIKYIKYKNPKITTFTKYELWNLYTIQNKILGFYFSKNKNERQPIVSKKSKMFWHVWPIL